MYVIFMCALFHSLINCNETVSSSPENTFQLIPVFLNTFGIGEK